MAGVAPGLAAAFSGFARAAAPPTLPQTRVAYRPAPDGDRKSDTCKRIINSNVCQKAEGDFGADGCCILYRKA